MIPARTPFALLLLATSALLNAGRASACGASGPDGSFACSLEDHEAESRRWAVGGAFVYTDTALRFGGDRRADETRSGAVASLGYRVTPRFTLQGALGASLGGNLVLGGGATHALDPGFTAAFGTSFRVLDASDARPFVVLTAQLAMLATTTREQGVPAAPRIGYEAFDLRAGALVGWTLFDVLTPYLVGRIFGGPAFWRIGGEAVTGTDVAHYQVGGAASVLLARRVSLFAEGVPLGERAVSGGAAVLF